MKVERTTFPGWSDHPLYRVKTQADYRTIGQWMCENECDDFLVSSGSYGYVFQVRKNHDWFLLRCT